MLPCYVYDTALTVRLRHAFENILASVLNLPRQRPHVHEAGTAVKTQADPDIDVENTIEARA